MPDTAPKRLAARHSFLALARMAELEIKPLPRNYHLWFEIESGANPDLARETEFLLNQGLETFDDDRLSDLFERHIGTVGRQERLDAAEEDLSGILEALSKLVDESSAKAEGSSEAINSVAGQIEGVEVVSDLRSLVTVLAKESRAMVDNNKALTERLSEASQQVDALKADLRMARDEALSDQLTGLCNRKAFDNAIKMAVEGVEEEGLPSLLLLDVDHFKSFNDRFGHTVGDEVLKIVGRCLQENVKGKDTAARYGGEEFAIILPGTESDKAVILADQIRSGVEAKRFRRRTTGETLPTVTISIGVARFREGEDARVWIERADAALYQAKAEGRNRVVAAPDKANEQTAAA